jgi:hypothetical protein
MSIHSPYRMCDDLTSGLQAQPHAMHDSVAWQGGNNILEHVMSVGYDSEEHFSHPSHLKRAGHGKGRRESARKGC